MNFKRKITKQIVEWKQEVPKKSALLIEGARRVGKTTIVKNFAKENYKNYLLLDFTIEPDEVKKLFKNLTNLDDFFINLFLAKGKRLEIGDLIIFDEIQSFPLARQAIKHLVKDGRYDYIETGSLLSIRENVKDILIPSEETRIEMFPMDFEEFLWALNKKDIADLVKEMYEKGNGLSDAAHNMLNTEFRKYIAIGGMPLVVSEYIETNANYLKCHKIKNDICKLYKDDLHKHDLLCGTKCEKVWDAIPSMLRNESTRFVIGLNGNKARYSSEEKTFGDIVDSKTTIMVNKLVEPTPGNEIAMSEGQFRLYGCDSGLLVTSIYKDQNETIEDIYKKIILDDSDANLGSAYESIIAQTLLSNGYKPYYHKYEIERKNEKGEIKISKYEIDFMIEHKGKILAIEVKSGRNFTTSSLDNLKEKYSSYKFEKIVISGKQYKRTSDTLYLPIYMSFCL